MNPEITNEPCTYDGVVAKGKSEKHEIHARAAAVNAVKEKSIPPGVPVSEWCRKANQQACWICDDLTCEDNTSEEARTLHGR
jgi:hypothetical protein